MAEKNLPQRSKEPHLSSGSTDSSACSLFNEPTKLSKSESKEQLKSNPYVAAKSISADSKFWNACQENLYNRKYTLMPVFKHRFVDWSKIANGKMCACDVSIKYMNLGLKDLTSFDETWAWNEELIKQFYATLYINPDRTSMEFMIGSEHYVATKEDFEKALRIEPKASSIILHTPDRLSSTDALSLSVVPELDPRKFRKNCKPEVGLIAKINVHTIFPRIGNRDGFTKVLCKLSHAIYHQNHFDVAHFLLSEMCVAIETPHGTLPYAPYIVRLLHHLKVIMPENTHFPCVPKKYSPHVPKPIPQHGISVGPDGHPQDVDVQHETQVEQDGQTQDVTLNEMEGEQNGQDHVDLSLHEVLGDQDTQQHVTQHGVSKDYDLIEHVHSSYNQPQQADHFDSLMRRMVQLSKRMDMLNGTVDNGFKMMNARISHLSSKVDEIDALLMENLGPRVIYKRKRLNPK